MTVSIHVEPKTKLAICTCVGILSVEDAMNGAKSLWQTPGWSGKAAVWDFRKASFDMSSSEVKKVAQFIIHHQPASPPEKMAFVAHGDLEYGMSRMFEVYRQNLKTDFRVFRDIEEALNWAGMHEPDDTPKNGDGA
jgi:hypothetical protein